MVDQLFYLNFYRCQWFDGRENAHFYFEYMIDVLILYEQKNGGKNIKKRDNYKYRLIVGFLGYVFLYANGNK